MELHGVELHHTIGDTYPTGSFYRVVRADNTVITRWGPRGSVGNVRTHTFSSVDKAIAHVEKREIHYWCHRRFHKVFAVDTCLARPPDDPEVAFTSIWTHDAANMLADTHAASPAWVFFTGLVTEYGRDRTATAMLDRIRTVPHAINYALDRVVALVPSFPTPHLVPMRSHTPHSCFGYFWQASRIDEDALTEVDQPELATRTAELLAYLIDENTFSTKERRLATLAAARRLVRTSAPAQALSS